MVARVGVPVLPGSDGPVASAAAAREVADAIGYPVMLKAAAGGGGIGMALVSSPERLDTAFAAAERRAGSAFGDAAVYVERAIERPRHVEVQVLADDHDTLLHLFERDCSIQRRHQKLVEESRRGAVPSSGPASTRRGSAWRRRPDTGTRGPSSSWWTGIASTSSR